MLVGSLPGGRAIGATGVLNPRIRTVAAAAEVGLGMTMSLVGVETDLSDEQVRAMWNRRMWSRFVLMFVALATSAAIYLAGRPATWEAVLTLLAAVLTAGLGMRTTFDFDFPWLRWLPFWPSYAVLLVLCLALPVVAGSEWAFNAAWAGAATGWLGGKWFAARLLAIGAVIGSVVVFQGGEPPMVVVLSLIGVMVGFFTNQARRQFDIFEALRESRRDRARLAVADERDRIARDLHDLVGHSLSVIAVKTELARRLVTMDAAQAERELADIDAVVRRALSEVRQAVTNYRQPTLAGELASAKRAAASAGIDCRVESPDSWALPAPVDGTLAWSVREGVTNVLRHSRASRCTITLSLVDHAAEVEIVDDGVGPGESRSGNGLNGLTERAQALGGSLTAGPCPGSGFCLRIRVPT